MCGGSEEVLKPVFVGMLLELVAEQEDSGFVVLVLPGLQETVGRGQGRNVILVNRRVRRSGADTSDRR